MISTEDAYKMTAEKMKREAEPAQPEEQPKPTEEVIEPESKTEPEKVEEPKEEPKPEAEEPKAEEKPEETKPEPEEQPKDDKPVESKDKDKDNRPPSQKYSHEDRVKHSFAKEKERRKTAEKENKALKARNEELQKELDKYKGLTLADFDNKVEDYVDYKTHEQSLKSELDANKKLIERSEADMEREESERRVNLSFADEAEKAEYYDLLETRGEEFQNALKTYDKENVVLQYLARCEQHPKVLKALMEDSNALGYVFQDRDPNARQARLHSLAQYIIEGKQSKRVEEVPQQTKAPEPPKPAPLPVIGKQVTVNAGRGAEPVHDRAYWNNYLRQHPRG